MPQIQAKCPQCHQPVMANVEQLFDTSVDPEAKQRILTGYFNLMQCPNCGYSGTLATPIVYHDAEKQLLLTYFPPEMMVPVNEQEKSIGPLITQVVNRLPAEKRKAYLFTPKAMLTFQQLVETILEGDGITREMLDNQQKRLNLIQRLMQTSPDVLEEVVKQEDAVMDESFFAILNRLIEASIQARDEKAAKQLAELQQKIMPISTVGQELQKQAKEAEAAIASLKAAGEKGLSRESLLDLLIKAPNDIQLQTLATLAASGFDYQFFQILTERIEKSSGDERDKLVKLREYLLKLTQEIEKQIQERKKIAHQNLETLLKAGNIEQATLQNLEAIDEIFVDVLKEELQAARQKSDLERSAKIQQVLAVLEKASTPPPEYKIIEELLMTSDSSERKKILEKNKEKITPELVQMLSGLAAQAQQQNEEPEAIQQIQEIYREALRFSMQTNLQS
jgi:hypothetical protein